MKKNKHIKNMDCQVWNELTGDAKKKNMTVAEFIEWMYMENLKNENNR